MPIAILGTGRSGTSMVARMLNLCGLYMGDQDGLWDPRSNPRMNPTGYWEHREIHALMDRLFEHLGGTWENPPCFATAGSTTRPSSRSFSKRKTSSRASSEATRTGPGNCPRRR